MTTTGTRVIAGLALTVATLGLIQCDRQRSDAPVADAPSAMPRPTAQTALSRGELIAALAQAGSAFSAVGHGGADATIAGRTFEISLPFGCRGPDVSEPPGRGLARWGWSPDRASIALGLTPDDLTRSALVVPAGETPTWDRVEGYWIDRPWLADDTCPRPASPAPAVPVPENAPVRGATPARTAAGPVIEIRPLTLPPSPQTAGLVVIQGAEASRLGHRRGQAYSFVVRGSAEQPAQPPVDGYRLVLSGRVGSFPDGRPIRCASESPDRRPVCLAAIELDRVAFETASGELLSEWRPG